MALIHPVLLTSTTIAVLSWAALIAYVLLVQWRRGRAHRMEFAALALLRGAEDEGVRQEERLTRLQIPLARASRELVMRMASDRAAPDHARDTLARYLVQRWGKEQLLGDAARHHTAREKWRRIAALRALVQLEHPRSMELLAAAVEGDDPDVVAAAVSLLGTSPDPVAATILIRALQAQRHESSRVAAYLDRMGTPVLDQLRILLNDRNPVVRQWAAALMGRYTGDPRAEEILLPFADDPDPRVRKAAVEALGRVGGEPAAQAAVQLLLDPTPFVRANAARALGTLDRVDLAGLVAGVLGDADWWVRRAAKESLVTMGVDVWPVLMHCLEQPDRFVRNGAAEVIQDLGVLDSLIVMEAASDSPSASKILMLRRIAEAGGMRFTESLVERAGPEIGPRIRNLLSTLGLAHVGAAG